ncbi:MAG: NUDIX domain-containing protein [Candidatus Dojkabacteria bacterium]
MQVLAVIQNNDLILIGKLKPEKVEDFGGIQYIFPGGTVEENEKLVKAVIRESLEETGLNVNVVKEIGFRIHPKTQKEIHYFHCVKVNGELSTDNELNDDIDNLEWVKKERLFELMPTLFNEVKIYLESLT